ncbi:MAG: DUF3078 domain-containing protein, partial [Cyclobacteriaceae bacterium]|nr:DUF3078 domain-containing protein [Cyclobacteriaceae bacterium]
LDFRTQFYRGVNADGDRISEFMAPGYLLVATGLDWKPSPVLSATYAPVTGKFTFVRNQELANAGAFGVTPGIPDPVNPAVFLSAGSRHRAELGSFLKVMFNKENLLPNVTVASKLELFSNYLKDFGNVDVNWQNMVSMKVNNLLTVNWQSQLIYDHDIKIEAFDDAGLSLGTHPRTQFKSVFGVGISYRFGATK